MAKYRQKYKEYAFCLYVFSTDAFYCGAFPLMTKVTSFRAPIFVTFEDDCMFEFYQELQKILPDQEAMILMEVGNEKLRYVVGLATIVTNKEIRYINMEDAALKTVRSMVGEDFTTQMDY